MLLCQEASTDACLRASIAGVVAAASLTTSGDGDTAESKVGATAITTENVVVSAIVGASTSNINERDTSDGNTVGWVTGWTTVEVVLLNIDAVV